CIRDSQWLVKRTSCLNADLPWLFLSRKGTPLSRQHIHVMMRNYGVQAGIAVPVHPHMLRHACGYALAEEGVDTRLIQDYLGHRNIQHTVLYTASNPARFSSITL
ncbi:integrase, partial [Klebsiella michiganensis]